MLHALAWSVIAVLALVWSLLAWPAHALAGWMAANAGALASLPEWIERWQPQVALLSVAAGDAQGRPDAEVMEALEGYTVLRTDQNGWIELTMDGERMWVEVERR